MHVLLSLLAISAGSSAGVLAVWAGSSHRHWFARTLVVVGPLGTLLLVPAYEPFVAFIVEAAVIVSGLFAVRWFGPLARRGSHAGGEVRPRLRFSVGSLLCLMLLVGVAAAVAVRLPRLSWTAWLNTVHVGAGLGAAVLLGVWIVRGRMRKRTRVPIALAASILFAIPLVATDYLLDSFSFGGEPWPPPGPAGVTPPYSGILHWLWLAILPVVSCVTGLWLTLALHARDPNKLACQAGPRFHPLPTAAAIVLSGVLALLPLYVLYRMLTPTPIPQRDYPEPNGWDLLATATRAVQTPVLDDFDAATPTALQAAVAAKQTAYDQFREALAHRSLAPFKYHDEFLGGRRLTELQDFRGLARAVIAEGGSAEFEQRLGEAATIYADSIELGQRITSGGMLIHALVGGAIQNLGNSALAKIRRRLSGPTAGTVARRLSEIEGQREPFEALLANDRIWMQHALGWHGRTTLALTGLAGEELELHALVRRSYLRATTLTRLLTAELAVAAYAAEHGAPPADLNRLSPGILPAALIDPFSREPLRYRSNGNEWLVYSVGYDGRDEEGRSPSDNDYLGWESGDISLDNWQEWLESQ